MFQGRIYYGWFIVAASLLNLTVLYGVWYSYSVFMVLFTNEFGWSRTGASSIFALFTMVIGVTAPLIGHCVDRFGPKRVLTLGGLILALGLFFSSRASTLVSFYISFGLVTGLGGSAIGLVGNSRAVANWFVEKRGLASGIATSGIGLGMLVIVPLVQVWVQQYGWRAGFLMLALLSASLLIPLNILVQKRGEPPLPEVPEPSTPGGIQTLAGLIRQKTFWRVFTVFFTGGFIVQAVVIHQVALATDAGFSVGTIRWAVILLGLFGICGRIFWGILSDRIGRNRAYLLASVMLTGGLCLILLAAALSSPAAFYGYTFLYGTGYGAIAPLNWSIAADVYSGAQFGAIYGSLFMGTGLGASLGPLWSGIVFDLSSSYALAFLSAAALLLLSNMFIHRLYVQLRPGR
jgi:MFS family permease